MTRRWRSTWRRLSLGLPTLLGLARRGYFIPYRYADGTGRRLERRAYPAVRRLLSEGEASMRTLVEEMNHLTADLDAISGDRPPQPRWAQDWFPRLDAAAAYVMTRTRRPARIVEIGAGHSTRFFARAVGDGDLATRLTAIDPAPRAAIRGLNVTFLENTVQHVGLEPFSALDAGDILSIDSSHILMPGTDVDVMLGDVLPMLAPGTLVHIHDMFLPDAYPGAWEWRGYNEQAAVAAMIGAGGWRILWSSHHVATAMRADWQGTIIERLPINPGAIESSLWLEKVALAG